MAPDPHAQEGFRRRFDWGRGGARGLARHVDVAVVVDVLSFSTSVDVAVARSCEVVPVAWGERRSAGLSADEAGVLAVGRRATSPEHPYSLSPAPPEAVPQGTPPGVPPPKRA